MTILNAEKKIYGVIEGFYGKPWHFEEKNQLMQKMHAWGLNTYLFAPKFDLKHRLQWDKPYTQNELNKFHILSETAMKYNIRFIYSLSPGLSINPDNQQHIDRLILKFKNMVELGINSFGLLLDDIPVKTADSKKHSQLANQILDYFKGKITLFFCPTAYSGWHLQVWEQAHHYLESIGKNLYPEIYVFWTGQSIVPRMIKQDDLTNINQILNRKVIIWDNYFATDYLPASSVFGGPFMYRNSSVMNQTNGYLINPSQYFQANLVPIATFSDFIEQGHLYDPYKSWLSHLTTLYPENHQLLETVLGYFYSPFQISGKWDEIFHGIVQTLSGDNSKIQQLKNELTELKTRLHQDSNLLIFGSIWEELFPFIQTLYGDIDYMLKLITTSGTNQQEYVNDYLNRDQRWSTPLHQLIRRLSQSDKNGGN